MPFLYVHSHPPMTAKREAYVFVFVFVYHFLFNLYFVCSGKIGMRVGVGLKIGAQIEVVIGVRVQTIPWYMLPTPIPLHIGCVCASLSCVHVIKLEQLYVRAPWKRIRIA